MKDILNKISLATGLMLLAGLASAHSQSGSLGKISTGAAATDVYQVNCFDDGGGAGAPSKLLVHVKDNLPNRSPVLSVQITKGGLASTPSVDNTDGDGAYSPFVSLSKGAGDYTVVINKSSSIVKGLENYSLEYHCESASGAHAGTDEIFSQNQ